MPLFLIPILAGFRSALSAVLAFCSKPPGSWIAAALAFVIALWWYGQHEFNRGVAKCQADGAKAAANINAGQPKIIERLRTIYVPAEAKIKTVTQTVVKEVPIYVTKRDDAACTLNNGFVRVHDAAAKGELPAGPTGTDGDASGVELSTVATTVTWNYGIANLCSSRLSEWQDWYRQNKTLFDQNK